MEDGLKVESPDLLHYRQIPRKMLFLMCLFLMATVFGVVCVSDHSAAATVYVNSSGGSDSNNGLTPATAKQTIKNAAGTAASGDTVSLADGIYNQTGDRGITIDKDLTISGSSQSGTIIDGQSQNRIFTIASGVTVNIMDLTLKSGGGPSVTHGGAINVASGSDLTIDSVTFTGNNAAQNGGAIYNTGGDVEVTDSIFNNGNGANQNGGAIYSSGGSLTVDGSSFNANFANTAGGAIYNSGGSTLTITDSTFTNNQANQEGGAVYSTGSTDITVDGSTFTSNKANGRGGAIYAVDGSSGTSGSLEVTDSTFASNSVFERGGAIFSDVGGLEITGSTMTSNSAGYQNGGALYSANGVGEVHNNIIIGNNINNSLDIVSATTAVNATNNWWGSNDNPSNRVNSPGINVLVNPWIQITKSDIYVNPNTGHDDTGDGSPGNHTKQLKKPWKK